MSQRPRREVVVTRLELFEPRWHGFARWQLTTETAESEAAPVRFQETREQGWVRRPRAARYRQFVERNVHVRGGLDEWRPE